MKNKDLKKGKESIIGKIIYGFLLFMPLLAIFSTILINTFNMETKAEDKIIYKYETNEVNTIYDLVEGNIYHMNITCTPNNDSTIRRIQFTEWYNFDYSNYTLQTNTNQADINVTPCLQKTSSGSWYFHAFKTNTNLIYFSVSNNTIQFDFVYYTQTNFDNYVDSITKCTNIPVEEVEQQNTEDIFYYSVDKVTESSLFNWAENSIIYTGIENTCTQLSITTPFIPLLLAYWLIISVIYILYDIILMILIILHNKVHQIQDSI